jgi:rod shape-determining protein MreB and related proteins
MRFKLRLFDRFVSDFSQNLGVDLGTVQTRILLKGRGVLIDEPSCVARQKQKRYYGMTAPQAKEAQVVAYGKKAAGMVGKEPKRIEVVNLLKDGVISDYKATEDYLSGYLKKVGQVKGDKPRLLGPKIIANVAGKSTSVEKRAVRSVLTGAGAREVILVEEGLLAALGAELPVLSNRGMMVVNIGGGVTEIALISLGGIVLSKSLNLAGNQLTLAIVDFVRMKYGVLIGMASAERIKIEVGSVTAGKSAKKMAVVRGRDLGTGLPKSIRLNEGEVREALVLKTQNLVSAVLEMLEETPPELTADVLQRGIVLTGGGALLGGIDKLIEEGTKMPTFVAKKPEYCVVRGCQKLLENEDLLTQVRTVGGL